MCDKYHQRVQHREDRMCIVCEEQIHVITEFLGGQDRNFVNTIQKQILDYCNGNLPANANDVNVIEL